MVDYFLRTMKTKGTLKSRPEIEHGIDEGIGLERLLILHNDDEHSFDYVIDTLVEVCDMDLVQAEQCTYLVHYKGKCDIKKGAYGFLNPFRQGLIDRGLNATID